MPVDRKSKIDVSPTQVKILSDPTRLRILSMLFEREESISGLAKALGLTPATVHPRSAVAIVTAMTLPATRGRLRFRSSGPRR